MHRSYILGLALLPLLGSAALAQSGIPAWACAIPPAKDTVSSLDKVPGKVAALVKQRFPGVKPTMADCPQYGPTSEADKAAPCLFSAAHFGDEWVVVVYTRGSNPVRGISVIMDSKLAEARELMPQQSGIPRCSVNRIAGIITPTSNANSRPLPPPPVVRKAPSPG